MKRGLTDLKYRVIIIATISKYLLSEKHVKLAKCKDYRNQLLFACILKYYELNHVFFEDIGHIPNQMRKTLAEQLILNRKIANISIATEKTYHIQIRKLFKTAPGFQEKEQVLKEWLIQTILPKDVYTEAQIIEISKSFFQKQKIKPVYDSRVKRVYHSALAEYEKSIISETEKALTDESKALLNGLLLEFAGETENKTYLTYVRENSQGISIDSILTEADKLSILKKIQLPESLNCLSPKFLLKYYRYLCVQKPGRIKEMADSKRHFILAVFVLIRKMQTTDNIIELFIKLTQRSVQRSKKYIKNIFSNISVIKKVYGKKEMLYLIAQACLDNPKASIAKTIFPVVPKKKLKKIIKEYNGKKKSGSFKEALHERIRTSYISHYRRLLDILLDSLEFNTNNKSLESFLSAVKLIKEYSGSKLQYYPDGIDIPVDNVIKQSQKKFISSDIEEEKVNRISYEICVLQNLRGKLKCREIWVEKAQKYRNPEEDLPKDFDTNKQFYFDLLKMESTPEEFINYLKEQLNSHLHQFNKYIGDSKDVKIFQVPRGHIYVPKLKPQVEPSFIKQIKKEVTASWPTIDLLDILKETEFHTGFTKGFESSGLVEKIEPNELQKRLLLILFAYGTNTGLKRMSTGNIGVTYDELKYIRNRYLNKENLRDAIIKVVNKIIEVKKEDIWGESTTSVASDSKLYTAWDQNLLTQWHPRYNKFGVMIYWHVDKKSTCIYSQLKSCTSSEVASMIQGVLHHCTNAEVKKNYTDTHGGSLVGFAFSHLLGFDLLVRFKNIHKQRLYVSEAKDLNAYTNLETIINGSIQWDLIKTQYEQIVKYTAALKLGTADAEIILKPFSSTNYKHPTYQALCELGKVIKSIFPCRYLSSMDLRQEIHESLNVVERWNGINDFIFYGKSGEIRSNRQEDMELTVLSLHLFQISMVYINTLMIQEILSDKEKLSRLSIHDKRAITPLLYEHINPYGLFLLDMNTRINIYRRAA
jgi:TnpA family transposase